MLEIVWIAAALAGLSAALVVLEGGWRRARVSIARRSAVLLLVALAMALWIGRFGAEIGIPLFLETSALIAFGFILTRSERRDGRREPGARVNAPSLARPRRWAGAARFFVAGPLGFVAAMGIAILIVTRAPGAEQTRLILAGLIVPSLWSAAIGWVAADRRLPVQAATFCLVGLSGFGISLLAAA